jgi:hypothetical protein
MYSSNAGSGRERGGRRVKGAFRSGWLTLTVAVVAIPCVLCLGAFGYWWYVNSVPPFTPRLPPLPRPNGYDRAWKAIVPLIPFSRQPVPDRWPDGTPAELRARLVTLRPLLDEVRASFALEWRTNPPLSFSVDFPEIAGFRECARGFAAESILARRRGDYGTAMQRSLDAVELGVRMPRGGGLLARMAAVEMIEIGFSQSERLAPLVPATWVPDTLARVRRLRKAWPPLSEMFESEHITDIAAWTEEFCNSSRRPLHEQIRALDPLGTRPGAWGLLRRAFTPRRIVLADIDLYYRRLIAESRKPFRRRVPVPAPEDPWSELIFRGDGVMTWPYEEAPTLLTLLEVALAARLYHREHGRYPATLLDIGREWLPAVPVDFWGQPVAYRLRNGQPLIYSLGPDGKDNGGLAANPFDLHPGTRGDLVFGKLNWNAGRN